MIVTEDGCEGSPRDQRTRMSPTFAKYSLPSDRMWNPFRVSRNDCRLSLRDLNRGLPTRPLCDPAAEAKKFE